MTVAERSQGRSIAAEAHEPVVSLVRKLMLLESAMYSIVTPMLPYLARTIPATKPQLGVLAGAYAAGLIPGSLLGGLLAVRIGVRRTTFFGVVMFAIATPAFGFATGIIALDVLRTIQGVASGLLWGGGLTWVVAVAPEGRRGEMIGSTISAAIVGMLIGPALGVAAVATSVGLVFSLVGAAALVAAVLVARSDEPGHRAQAGTAPARVLLRSPSATLGTWLTVLEATAFGALYVLIPLRMALLGASNFEIGITFVLSSAMAMFVAPRLGVICDRRGSFLPIVFALAASALMLVGLRIPDSGLLLAALSLILMGGPLSAFIVPSVTMISASAEKAGVALAVSTMVFNLAYALGETVGAPVAAYVSHHTSDAVPFAGLAVLMLLTLVPVVRWRSQI
jgi:predicted MFS family arabinose efflux permease